ncbi:MAG: hypothetical protein H6Q99_243 [Proteobacteria bacterium]|nr:hypothetical protein [Pseudomonadota bacterium]
MSRLPPLPLPSARGARPARFLASLAFMMMVVGIASRHMDFISTGTMYTAIAAGLLLGLAAVAVLAVTVRDVWREGRRGADSAFGTLLLIVAAFSPLIGAVAAYVAYPALDNVSTDPVDPPSAPADFVQVVLPIDLRAAPAEVAALQEDAYPELTTQVVDLSTVEAYALARQAVDDLGWVIRLAEEPDTEEANGRIEAEARSLVLGTQEDVVVRIRPGDGGSRIDVRSLSRVAMPDLGENARHVSDFIARFVEMSRRQAAN